MLLLLLLLLLLLSAPQAQQVPHQFGGQFRQIMPCTEYTAGHSTQFQNQPFNQLHPSTQLSGGVYGGNQNHGHMALRNEQDEVRNNDQGHFHSL